MRWWSPACLDSTWVAPSARLVHVRAPPELGLGVVWACRCELVARLGVGELGSCWEVAWQQLRAHEELETWAVARARARIRCAGRRE